MFLKIKNFYLNNMKLIHKFLINQIAISIFGFTVIIAASLINTTAMTIATACAGLFFCALLYDSAWEVGAKDRNKVINGRLEERPAHGAFVALFSYIPTLVFVVPTAIFCLLSLCGVHFFDAVLAVFTPISIFLCNGMYLGFSWLLAGAFPNAYQLFFVIYLIPAVFSYWLGYMLGLKDKQIKTLLGMKPSTGAPSKPKQK